MSWSRWRVRRWMMIGLVMGTTASLAPRTLAGDLKVNLPKRSHLTPVQRLNRDGVEAVKKHNYNKAESLFYKAYLLDPNDPFTLNNLGYTSELQGQVERAQNFYVLAAQNAKALNRHMEAQNSPEARVAELNLRGVSAVNRNDPATANEDFRKAYAIDPSNAFALNNIGYVSELEGDRETAEFFYTSAQKAAGANAKVVLATRRAAEGRKLFEI